MAGPPTSPACWVRQGPPSLSLLGETAPPTSPARCAWRGPSPPSPAERDRAPHLPGLLGETAPPHLPVPPNETGPLTSPASCAGWGPSPSHSCAGPNACRLLSSLCSLGPLAFAQASPISKLGPLSPAQLSLRTRGASHLQDSHKSESSSLHLPRIPVSLREVDLKLLPGSPRPITLLVCWLVSMTHACKWI